MKDGGGEEAEIVHATRNVDCSAGISSPHDRLTLLEPRAFPDPSTRGSQSPRDSPQRCPPLFEAAGSDAGPRTRTTYRKFLLWGNALFECPLRCLDCSFDFASVRSRDPNPGPARGRVHGVHAFCGFHKDPVHKVLQFEVVLLEQELNCVPCRRHFCKET